MANKIGALRYWCTKVIPLVYDDSLSYYEVLCKVTEKLNEVIEVANAGGWTQEEIEAFVKQSVDEYLAEIDLPSSADIAQLQSDVDTAKTDIELIQTNKMDKFTNHEVEGTVVVVAGSGVGSSGVSLASIQQAIEDAETAADAAAADASAAMSTATAANGVATSALTAAQNAQNSASALDANKANKINGYTGSGKILVTGANDKTPVESDKSVDDFLEKRTGASGTEFAYTNTNNVNGQTAIDQNAIGNTLAKRYTNGRLKVGAPVDNNDAATKQYVDNAVAGATGGIPVIDFNGSYLGGSTSLALYNALNTIGYAIIKNASTVDSSAEPVTIVDGLVVGTQTSGGYTFSVQFYMNDENYTVCYQPQAYAVGSNGSITHS